MNNIDEMDMMILGNAEQIALEMSKRRAMESEMSSRAKMSKVKQILKQL